MCRSFAVIRALVLCALLPLFARAQAAPLLVRPIQNLSFGFLLPGVPTTIDPLTLSRSGQIEVQASLGAIFEIRYTLPTALTGPSGTLPLVFGSASAGASASRTPTDILRFDPKVATRFRFQTTDRATFFLGGEARPRTGQATGAYSAPIIVTITNLGV